MNPNDVMDQIEAAWSLLEKGELVQAREISEKLVSILQMRHEDNASLLQQLAHACHVAGFTVGLSVRSAFAATAGAYFDEMLCAARGLPDRSLCVKAFPIGEIALADMEIPTRPNAHCN